MQSSDWSDGDNILQRIKSESQQRRSNPTKFFRTFLSHIWKDNTDEEAMRQWKTKVEQAPWYAEDALYCINSMLTSPPKDLVEIMQQEGWIYLEHESDETPYTFDEYVAWLRQMEAEFRAVYENAPAHLDQSEKG